MRLVNVKPISPHRRRRMQAEKRRTRCSHCGAAASVTAERVRAGFRMPVRYCDVHHREALEIN